MSRLLTDLRPEARRLVDPALDDVAALGIDLIVTCTLRTRAEQEALFAQGRTMPGPIVTDAPPGTSAHQYGLALDVVPVVNGKCDWTGNSAVWQQVAKIFQSHGLEWAGAPGFPFHEAAHFQVPDWRALAGGE